MTVYADPQPHFEIDEEVVLPEPKLTFWKIAFAVFFGNVMTGLLVGVLYLVDHL